MAGSENTGQHGGKKQSCCGIQMGQTGFLKLMIALLAVLCITLGAFLVALHVNRQLSTESQFEELKNELKSIMYNQNDTMAELETMKRQIEPINDLTVELRELRVLVKDIEAKLNDFGTKDGDLRALESQLNTTEQQQEKLQSEVQRLGKENQEGPKVAFSASHKAPGVLAFKPSGASPFLAYKQVLTNTGNAYDPNTGTFTAPVKGMYFFSFTTLGISKVPNGAVLRKNGEHLVTAYSQASETGGSGGNSAILQLEAGDQVNTVIHIYSEKFANSYFHNGHTTFSGFLLYSL